MNTLYIVNKREDFYRALQTHPKNPNSLLDLSEYLEYSHPNFQLVEIINHHVKTKLDSIVMIYPFEFFNFPNSFQIDIPVFAICHSDKIFHPHFERITDIFSGFIPENIRQRNLYKSLELNCSDSCLLGVNSNLNYDNTENIYNALFILHPENESYIDLTSYIIDRNINLLDDPCNALRLETIKTADIVILDSPYLNRAHFEVLASEKLLLCHEGNVEILEYFEVDKDFVFFNESNFGEVFDFYNTNISKRKEIASSGFKKALNYPIEQQLSMALRELLDQVPNNYSIKSSFRKKYYFYSQFNSYVNLDRARLIVENNWEHSDDSLGALGYIYVKLALNNNDNLQKQKIFNSVLEQWYKEPGERILKIINICWLSYKLACYDEAIKYGTRAIEMLKSTVISKTNVYFCFDNEFVILKQKNSYAESIYILLSRVIVSSQLQLQQWELAEKTSWHALKNYSSQVLLQLLKTSLIKQNKLEEATLIFEQILQNNPYNIFEQIQYLSLLDKSLAYKYLRKLEWVQNYISAFGYLEFLYNSNIAQDIIAEENKISEDVCRIYWEGPVYSYKSLAIINYYIQTHLAKDSDFELRAIYSEPHERRACQQLDNIKSGQLSKESHLYISHLFPPRLIQPQKGKWIGIIPWEFGVVPSNWVSIINQQMDCLIVPSQFVADSFIRSGVSQDSIEVIPNGVNCKIYSPNGSKYPLKSDKQFKFIFVGGLLDRKGIDILLDAYKFSFSSKDDVCLVIKSFGHDGIYSQISSKYLDENITDKGLPEVVFINDSLIPEEMSSLYRSCDVYVHPYRGEGFGMPILEAMACGLPVIVPDQGPCLEFCDKDFATFIPTITRFFNAYNLGELGNLENSPFWCEVDIEKLAEVMRQHFENKNNLHQKGQSATLKAQSFDWSKVYLQYKQLFYTLYKKPVKRFLESDSKDNVFESVNYSKLSQKEVLEVFKSFQQKTILSEVEYASLLDLIHKIRISKGFEPLPFPISVQWENIFPEIEPLPNFENNFQLLTNNCEHSAPTLKVNIARVLSILESYPIATEVDEIWIADQSMSKSIIESGIEKNHIHHIPLFLDFEQFNKKASPLELDISPNAYAFLSIFDWRYDQSWKTILLAFNSAFNSNDNVTLILKPYGATLEDILIDINDWLKLQKIDTERIPHIIFVEEPLDEILPNLYTCADTFIGVNHYGQGIWHLGAQACQLNVISCGHFSFLKYPYSHVIKAEDYEHLSWLMKKFYVMDLSFNTQAILKYLSKVHDVSVVEKIIKERLKYLNIKDQFKQLDLC